MTIAGWNVTNKITLTIPPQSEELTGFPVRVNLSVASGTHGFDCSAVFTELGGNSKKIAVEFGDTGTQCYVEIERWDDIGLEAQLWVNVPAVFATENTVLVLYYDSTQPDNIGYIGVIGEAPAQSVWDTNYVGVYHMSESPGGAGACVLDSTINANNGTPGTGLDASNLVDGEIGKSIHFDNIYPDGTSDYIDIGSTPLTPCLASQSSASINLQACPVQGRLPWRSTIPTL